MTAVLTWNFGTRWERKGDTPPPGRWCANCRYGRGKMPVNPDFKDLLHHLNAAKVRYLVVGAYAVIHYTEPRYTKDMDFWIAPDPANAKKVYEVLGEFGAPVEHIKPEDLTNPEMVYQIGVEPNRIDIIMGIKELDFEEAWKKRVASTYGEEKVFFLGFDDLLKSKQTAGRPHDQLDVEALKFSKERKKKK